MSNSNCCFLTCIQVSQEAGQKDIMINARLDGIKIPGRNINNLTYADDTTLMAENKEGLKSLLMKVKEENEKLA